jgi:hypothetical protein
MHAPILRPARLRQGFALAMALLVAFLGVAVFSSLHKHQGAKSRCSLNGYDQLMTGEAEEPQTVLAALGVEWSEPPQMQTKQPPTIGLCLFLRGPPSTA